MLGFKKLVSLFLLILLLSTAGVVQAQRSFLDEANLRPFSAGGNISVTASAYTVSGLDNRRPPGLIQTNAGMNFTTFGLSSGLDLNYSTDDTGIRQNVNTFSYNVSWRWINVRAGDINTRFSEYGLNGTTIRGGYLKLEPGNFLVELTGGRTKRAIQPASNIVGFREPAFEQWAMGGKIGYGQTSRTYFHLSAFYAIDEKTSVQGNNLEITPRENLSISPDFQVRFLEGRITIGSDVTASIYTRDLNSDIVPLGEVDIPSLMKSIYTPRVSSRINYAGRANMNINLDLFSMNIGYMRVQPGFESLGKGRVRDDQERIQVSPTIRLFENRVNLSSNVSYGRDNLLGNRLQTQHNTSLGTNIQYSITEALTLNTVYNLILNRVVPEETEEGQLALRQAQSSHNIMVQPSYTFSTNDLNHNISLTGGYLLIESAFSDSNSPDDNSFTATSYSGGLNYSVSFAGGLTLNSTLNFLTNSSPDIELTNSGVVLGGSYALFNRRLSLSANAGMNQNRSDRTSVAGDLITTQLRQFSGSINSSFNLTGNDTFSLVLRTRSNMVVRGAGSEFTELEGSLRYQRRF